MKQAIGAVLGFCVILYGGMLIGLHRQAAEYTVCHQYVKDKTELICVVQANK